MTVVSGPELSPRLVVTSHGASLGSTLCLTADDVVLGRHTSADLYLDDPTVSRLHARFRRAGDQVVVQDLGSSGGTRVNGTEVREPRPLRNGDVVSFAAVETRFEQVDTDRTRAVPAVALDATDRTPSPRRFDVDRQDADQLSNVAGDQYNQYIQEIREDRTAFLQELATLKTKARRLVVVGFILFVAGAATYASVILRFISSVDDAVNSQSDQAPTTHLLGTKVGGVPLGIIGFACAGAGMVLLLVGIVCHVVAALKKRRFNQQAPQPWQIAPPAPRL